MNAETRSGLSVVGASLLLGILGDALLRETPWGINFVLWIAALAALAVGVAWGHRIEMRGEGRLLLPPILLFALLFVLRDSLALRTLDVGAVLCLLSLAALRSRSGKVIVAAVIEYPIGMLQTGFRAFAETFVLLFDNIRWKEIPRQGWMRHGVAIGRGLLIAIPLLVVFGALLTAADATFERMITKTFHFEPDKVAMHLITICAFAWFSAGYLHTALMREPGAGTRFRPDSVPPLGIVEIGIVLGLLDLLFFSFVCIQMRYFFGGQAHVLATAGLTSADYARRGFFEMVTVAALALPLLLSMDWLLNKETGTIERIFRALASVMTMLIFVIMASALQRMRLYQIGYGLTELRVYVTAFMGWLAAVFLWFVATVLRGNRDRFAFGALVAGLASILLLHVINPDALIVRTNLQVTKAHPGRVFDVSTAVSLSADAAPELISALPSLSPQGRQEIAANLMDWYPPNRRSDWRTWNSARNMAQRRIRQHAAELKPLADAFAASAPHSEPAAD